MTSRSPLVRLEPGFSLPVFDRLAPAPPPALVAARIDADSAPGDVVADLFGRGGWVARTALDRQRRAISLESSPLSRVLAEVVLRPPDVRHLDAAFQGMAASPRRDSSLKASLGEMFATRCATCGRTLVADEVVWATDDDGPRPVAKRYRCTVCRDQRGGSELREAPLDDDDLARATADVGAAPVRIRLAERFPPVEDAEHLVDDLLGLHTDRQLVGLASILERIEADLRAAPVLAALRLALLHALLPASRLASQPGRTAALRVGGGRVKVPSGGQWRERNPWLAFEEAFRTVRGFVQRLEGGPLGPIQARLGEDLRSLGEGTATTMLGLASPSGLRVLATDALGIARGGPGPRLRLVLGQPPLRPNLDRLALAYHGTAWVLGREAASLVPSGPLSSVSLRAPWSWQSAALGRALEAIGPAMARDGRVVLFVDGGPEAVATAVLGGIGAGYRLVTARLAEGDDDTEGIVEFLPPGAVVPPGPRTRGNVALPHIPGGSGDPDLVPGPGLFTPPERFDRRPFSMVETARTITDTAVEVLKGRGEPARYERLFGEILVGLDRAGQLRRFVAASGREEVACAPTPRGTLRSTDDDAAAEDPSPGTITRASEAASGTSANDRDADPGPSADGPDDDARALEPDLGLAVEEPGGADGDPRPALTGVFDLGEPAQATRHAGRSPAPEEAPAPDPVERLLALVRDELTRPSQRRLTEIEPGRWWLADRTDRETAAAPLADRVEWSVFSLLSTSGPMSESSFFERIASLFRGHDLPDETLVRACLDSYRTRGAPDRVGTSDDLLRRSQAHTELLAQLADAGHKLGMQVWLGRREQTRKLDGRPLGERLTDREFDARLTNISRAVDELSEVDCIWYSGSKVALLFEVEWTAMLGEPLLRRHARIPPDERLIRFLVIEPERTELVRYKLERSPLLRAALDEGNWHIIKADHLRGFLARDELDLDALEPLLGLDPLVERTGEQLPLFGG
jgi:hypothetical protein